MANYDELTSRSDQITKETVRNANSSTRIGTLFYDILEWVMSFFVPQVGNSGAISSTVSHKGGAFLINNISLLGTTVYKFVNGFTITYRGVTTSEKSLVGITSSSVKIGLGSSTSTGVALGSEAASTRGVAVGRNSTAGEGLALGNNSRVLSTTGSAIGNNSICDINGFVSINNILYGYLYGVDSSFTVPDRLRMTGFTMFVRGGGFNGERSTIEVRAVAVFNPQFALLDIIDQNNVYLDGANIPTIDIHVEPQFLVASYVVEIIPFNY